MRVFTPRRYAWEGAKWVNGLEFTAKDRLGFWEERGYTTSADLWKEERFGSAGKRVTILQALLRTTRQESDSLFSGFLP